MEFSFIQTQTFLHFLHQTGLLSDKQQASLFEDYSQSSSRKFIFILADFFKKLTPSDSYDLAYRLYTTWEKQKLIINAALSPNTPNNFKSEKITGDLNAFSNNINENSKIKRPENYKSTIRNYKLSNILKGFLEKVERKSLLNVFLALKNLPKKPKNNKNYMLHLEDFKNELINPTFRPLTKNEAFEEQYYEGPRPFLVTPYKSKESLVLNDGSTNRTLRDRDIKSPQNSQKQHKTTSIHEKLYKEANLKKINGLYLESVKQKNELEGCTFKPKIIKNIGEKHKENYYNGKIYDNSDNNSYFKDIDNNISNNLVHYEKLYQENLQRKQILQEKQKVEQENLLKECTFQPKITIMPLTGKSTSRKNKENEDIKRLKSFSSYEKPSNSLEIRDLNLNLAQKNLQGGIMSTKASKNYEIPAKNTKKSLNICHSNRKIIQSVYHESDFFAKK